jgi:hypothetical protein
VDDDEYDYDKISSPLVVLNGDRSPEMLTIRRKHITATSTVHEKNIFNAAPARTESLQTNNTTSRDLRLDSRSKKKSSILPVAAVSIPCIQDHRDGSFLKTTSVVDGSANITTEKSRHANNRDPLGSGIIGNVSTTTTTAMDTTSSSKQSHSQHFRRSHHPIWKRSLPFHQTTTDGPPGATVLPLSTLDILTGSASINASGLNKRTDDGGKADEVASDSSINMTAPRPLTAVLLSSSSSRMDASQVFRMPCVTTKDVLSSSSNRQQLSSITLDDCSAAMTPPSQKLTSTIGVGAKNSSNTTPAASITPLTIEDSSTAKDNALRIIQVPLAMRRFRLRGGNIYSQVDIYGMQYSKQQEWSFQHGEKVGRANLFRDVEMCVVCMSNAQHVLFLPCRHMSLCEECMKYVTDAQTSTSNQFFCPICRNRVDSFLNLKYK